MLRRADHAGALALLLAGLSAGAAAFWLVDVEAAHPWLVLGAGAAGFGCFPAARGERRLTHRVAWSQRALGVLRRLS